MQKFKNGELFFLNLTKIRCQRWEVSTICVRYHFHPNVFYRWRKQLFEGALAVFSEKGKKNTEAKINFLQAKLRERDKVISEIVSENIELKKLRWRNLNGQWVEPDV